MVRLLGSDGAVRTVMEFDSKDGKRQADDVRWREEDCGVRGRERREFSFREEDAARKETLVW